MNIRIKDIEKEGFVCFKTMLSPAAVWIYIPVFTAIISVYLAFSLHMQWYISKGIQENTANIILGFVIVVSGISAIRFRNIAALFFLALAVNFMIMEMDKTLLDIPTYGTILLRTNSYFYFALIIMAAWGIWHEEKIISFFNIYPSVRKIFLGMLMTYLTSYLITQRLFKHIPLLPNELYMHDYLEKITANSAHIFFLILTLTVLWYSFHKRMVNEIPEEY